MVSNEKKKNKSRAKKHAAIENISFFGTEVRIAPTGLYIYAKDYLNSAKSLPEPKSPFSPSSYYLILRSIELSLKAILSCKGYSLEKLSGGPLGHDLVSLLDVCEKQGMNEVSDLTQNHKSEIRSASVYYVEKVFEYPAIGEAVSGYQGTPDASILIEAAEILVKFNKEPCLSA